MIIKYTNSAFKKNNKDEKLLKAIDRGSGSTYKGVSSGTSSFLPKAADKAGMAAEKATRVFLQNSPDAYLPRPQQVGPSQWKGPTNTKNIGSVPGMSAAKRAASAAERASMAYQNAFLPTPKKQNTYGPQKWNGGRGIKRI